MHVDIKTFFLELNAIIKKTIYQNVYMYVIFSLLKEKKTKKNKKKKTN